MAEWEFDFAHMFSENAFRGKNGSSWKSSEQKDCVSINLLRLPHRVLQQAEQAKVGPGPAEVYCLLERFRWGQVCQSSKSLNPTSSLHSENNPNGIVDFESLLDWILVLIGSHYLQVEVGSWSNYLRRVFIYLRRLDGFLNHQQFEFLLDSLKNSLFV